MVVAILLSQFWAVLAGITCGFSVNFVDIPGRRVPLLCRGHELGAAVGDQGSDSQNLFLVLLKLLK